MGSFTTLLQHTQSHFLSYATGFNTLLLLSCRSLLGRAYTSRVALLAELREMMRSSGSQTQKPSEATTQKTPSIPGTLPERSSPTSKSRYSFRGTHDRKYPRVCAVCATSFMSAMPHGKYCGRDCNSRAYYYRRIARLKARQP